MSKKYVMVNFFPHEADALKNYLEARALEGWKLDKLGNFFLCFSPCTPHTIRYCVEIMERPSVYASNQTPERKGYREFCREAGWDYLGCSGYFHVFCTESPEAIEVETDPELRFQHIVQAENGIYKLMLPLVILLAALSLAAFFEKGTLLTSNTFCLLLMAAACLYSGGSSLRWKNKAAASLAADGVLPHSDWKRVRLKNRIWTFGLLAGAAIYTIWILAATVPSGYTAYAALAFAVYLLIFFLLMFLFSRVLFWLREKRAYSKNTNIALYWGAALASAVLICVVIFVFFYWFFS